MDETLDVLDRRWKSACKVIFKEGIGDLKKYEKWLTQHLEPSMSKKSSISGGEVTYQVPYYGSRSKWAGLDEIDIEKKYKPLGMNEIKDIDSIIGAINDRAYYVGNVVLGNSKFVERSTNISDSFYVYRSSIIADCQYVAYCNNSRSSDSMFGCEMTAEDSYLIKCHGLRKGKRCFEVWQSDSSSDCYFSQNIQNCTDCIFCFNARSKKYAIGNLELGKSEYQKICSRLLEQVRGELESKGEFLPMVSIVVKNPAHIVAGKAKTLSSDTSQAEKTDKRPIEKAFEDITSTLLKRKLSGIDQYGEWLKKYTREVFEYHSAFSGKRILVAHYGNFELLPSDRLIDLDEVEKAGSLRISREAALGITIGNAASLLSDIAYFCAAWRVGKSMNMIDCVTELDASNCYRTVDCIFSKYAAYCFWPRSSEHVFGCNSAFDSSHCLKCYFSKNLTRCFEVDASHNCSDCYFCHNIDNCHDCMFCFNAKNLKYAIGNAEYSKEDYMKVKKRILEEIAGRLEKENKLEWDIYSIGGR